MTEWGNYAVGSIERRFPRLGFAPFLILNVIALARRIVTRSVKTRRGSVSAASRACPGEQRRDVLWSYFSRFSVNLMPS
jgi:hypothetical protein